MRENIFRLALDINPVGFIIINHDYNIIYINRKIEKLSGSSSKNILEHKIHDIFPVFNEHLYKKILYNAFRYGQARFCSNKLHKAFIYPNNVSDLENIKQNMTVQPFMIDEECYTVIEIVDITQQVYSQHRLTNVIYELEKGYEEAKRSEEKNRILAEYDSLTGLLNRLGLRKYLHKLLTNNLKSEKSINLVFMDVDDFKKVNDNYGHLVGDELLIQVGKRLKSLVNEDDLVCRLGGDEFVLVVSTNDETESINKIATNILSVLAEPYVTDNQEISITVSVGITICTNANCNDTISVDELIEKADYAMYEAKKAGKNGYRFYNKSS